MATSTRNRKPAEKATQPAAKPAAKPAEPKPAEGVTLKDLAAMLQRNPKSVRAAIRRIKGGAQVGQGGRYHWASTSDPEFVELLGKLKGEKKEEV